MTERRRLIVKLFLFAYNIIHSKTNFTGVNLVISKLYFNDNILCKCHFYIDVDIKNIRSNAFDLVQLDQLIFDQLTMICFKANFTLKINVKVTRFKTRLRHLCDQYMLQV